jgi:tRNA G18 (ribose-2'-O)-methylase SpoU
MKNKLYIFIIIINGLLLTTCSNNGTVNNIFETRNDYQKVLDNHEFSKKNTLHIAAILYTFTAWKKQPKIFGLRAIIEAINSNKTIDKVFLQKGLRGELFNELDSLIRNHSINVSYVHVEKLNRLTNKNHQGVVAQISPIEFYNLEDLVINVIESGKMSLFLLLDQISDVRNFGAIIRTTECTGVDGDTVKLILGRTQV